MAVYLKPGMAYQPQKVQRRSVQRVYYQSSKRHILHGFLISTLVILNIGLIAIAMGWYLLVFSIFQPAEIIEMYSDHLHRSLEAKEVEHILTDTIFPPPPVPLMESETSEN